MRKVLSFILTLFVFVSVTIIPDDIYATSRTRDEAVNWANSRVGQTAYDKDGAYGAQCVDFILEYYDYLGVSRSSGNGCDYASNTLPSGFTRIQNYYGFVPDPGDIAVWTLGWNGNVYGHVGVITSADLYNVTVADIYGSESGNSNQLVHSTTYSYNGNGMNFWGVIRPNWTTQPTEPPHTVGMICNYENMTVALGTTIEFNWWAYNYDSFDIVVTKNGVEYERFNNVGSPFYYTPTEIGNYMAYGVAKNSAGVTNANERKFYISATEPPYTVGMVCNYENMTVTLGTTIEFNWWAYNYESFDIVVTKNGVEYERFNNVGRPFYYTPTEIGNYMAYGIAKNNAGTTKANERKFYIRDKNKSPTITSYIENQIVYTKIDNLNQAAKYVVATYDKDNKIIEFAYINISKTAGSTEWTLNSYSDAAYIKVFLWDLNNKPLTKSEKIDIK